MNEPHDLLTTAEVALILRAPVSTVRYWRYLTAGPRGAGHRHRLDVRIVGIDLVTRHPRRVGVAERTPAGVVVDAGARRDLPAITAPQI